MSTGPKDKSNLIGNKRSVKTGEHETIWRDTLTGDEHEFIETLPDTSLEHVLEELLLITVRERRMMARIAKLQEKDTFMSSVTRTTGITSGKVTDNVAEHKESSLSMIQQIEEALTRVQEKKSKLIELKHKIETTQADSEKADISKFIEALGATVDQVWNDSSKEEEEMNRDA